MKVYIHNDEKKMNMPNTRDSEFLLKIIDIYRKTPDKLEEYNKRKEINVKIDEIINPKVVEERSNEFIISYNNKDGLEKTKAISNEYSGLIKDIKTSNMN